VLCIQGGRKWQLLVVVSVGRSGSDQSLEPSKQDTAIAQYVVKLPALHFWLLLHSQVVIFVTPRVNQQYSDRHPKGKESFVVFKADALKGATYFGP